MSTEHIEARRGSFSWRLACAALLPFIVDSIYLFFSRWPSYRFTEFSDSAGGIASIVSGAVFIVLLPIRIRWRIITLFVYVPVLFGALFIYSLLFIAFVFHDGP
jgi:hypothetical protein